MNKKDKKHITPYASGKMKYIQLFRERLSEKMCTRQSRRVTWDMFNTLFLTLLLSNLLLLLSFSTGRHMSMTSPAILSNFFEKQWTQNHPQYLSGLSRALYPTTFLEIAVYSFRLYILFLHFKFPFSVTALRVFVFIYFQLSLFPLLFHRFIIASQCTLFFILSCNFLASLPSPL